MSEIYTILVSRTVHMPLMQVYYLGKTKSFECVETTIEKTLKRDKRKEVMKGLGVNEAIMVKALLGIEGITGISIEPQKLIVHRDPWYEWEEVEERIKNSIECVLGEDGNFISSI